MASQHPHRTPLGGTHVGSQRKPSVKRLYQTGLGGVPIINAELEKQNQETINAREEAQRQSDVLTEAHLKAETTREANRKRRAKADAKKRESTLTDRLLAFAEKYLRAEDAPKGMSPQRWRREYVEQVLEDNPTLWEINRVIGAFDQTEFSSRMYASNLDGVDGRAAKESHRHEIHGGQETSAEISNAREAAFDRTTSAPLPSDPTIQMTLTLWNKIVEDGFARAEKDNVDPANIGVQIGEDISVRLPDLKAVLDTISATDVETARHIIWMVLCEAHDSETSNAVSRTSDGCGRRRRVRPRGWSASHDDRGRIFKGTSRFKVYGVEAPPETKKGKRMRKLGRAILEQERLQREVEEFNRVRKPQEEENLP